MQIAPWPDYNGKVITEGDLLCHPSGEIGRVIYIANNPDVQDQWKVDYGDNTPSRLCDQVGIKGQATVLRSAGS